ncbi:exonuclease SbcCD subunit D C-terminal domain-containing protein [Algoriphagus sp. AGSA1]|uniref:exonuclease SbcCD subunit D n=1 Tax=unclassified Algoriphagus TaxID=2641541 RepID=UPI00177CD930|nr:MULTISPECIES: exonuclease SbcCD subunit D C-terminal domain-containing protein [unclassified Algoriphagus]MCE7056244.1 exonuclease SbcCD subunit D C-terminal domain-containing protein [Algoriphagus sp. AGSA1]
MIKILHTADWHIGQLFHEYDRTYEHQQFLDWLTKSLQDEQVDVLLISGDVFDLSNPSAASIRLFYTFLNRATRVNPDLQVVITAGNHDSASRLESPKPLLESSNIHIVGLVEKDENGEIDYSQLIIPLKDKQGNVKAWCMAVPFLRMGDYPAIPDSDNPYSEGVATFYKEAYAYALAKKQPGQAIIAMGHLHAQQAEVSEMDKAERLIMGGVECISAYAFHEDIRYVALGHIHKAQRIGGKEYVRYCGSPIPMSFSELNYKHQVIVFDVDSETLGKIKSIEVPVSIPLQRIPAVHSTLTEVIAALTQLPETGDDPAFAPYLEVRVLLDGPEPALRHKVETALSGKHVRLAKIDVRYTTSSPLANKDEMVSPDQLNELQPLDVFSKVYQSRYGHALPEELLQLFHQVTQKVSQTE